MYRGCNCTSECNGAIKKVDYESYKKEYYKLHELYEYYDDHGMTCSNNLCDRLVELHKYVSRNYVDLPCNIHCRETDERDSLFSDGY
jgi:hypothetical protein